MSEEPDYRWLVPLAVLGLLIGFAAGWLFTYDPLS
jgi:hypothetical protein